MYSVLNPLIVIFKIQTRLQQPRRSLVVDSCRVSVCLCLCFACCNDNRNDLDFAEGGGKALLEQAAAEPAERK